MIALTPWLEHLEAHLPMAREGKDPEGVHQARVAARRLRVWLELAGYRVLDDDLRWLVRGAGRVRDLEVMLQGSLPKAYASWLKGKHEAAREALVPLLDSPRLSALLQALRVLPAISPALAKQRLERFERRVARRAQNWASTGDPADLHSLRRGMRRLRYAREFLDLDTADLSDLQDALGWVNDTGVALSSIETFEKSGGRGNAKYRTSLEKELEAGQSEVHKLLGRR